MTILGLSENSTAMKRRICLGCMHDGSFLAGLAGFVSNDAFHFRLLEQRNIMIKLKEMNMLDENVKGDRPTR